MITSGSDELLGYDRETNFSVMPPHLKPICTIGAGDVMIAELMFELEISGNFQRACEQGCRNAALKCLQWGVEL